MARRRKTKRTTTKKLPGWIWWAAGAAGLYLLTKSSPVGATGLPTDYSEVVAQAKRRSYFAAFKDITTVPQVDGSVQFVATMPDDSTSLIFTATSVADAIAKLDQITMG